MKDIFDKIQKNMGPIGQHSKESHGYFTFPKLEGDIAPHMVFRGKTRLNWSLNNYLGLANHPEVRKADADAAAQYGFALPMGARMMSGNSDYHEQLERGLSELVQKEDTILCNFGYQAMVSAIDAIVDRHDVIVYDAESHACILDGCACTWANVLCLNTTMWPIAKNNWNALRNWWKKPVEEFW